MNKPGCWQCDDEHNTFSGWENKETGHRINLCQKCTYHEDDYYHSGTQTPLTNKGYVKKIDGGWNWYHGELKAVWEIMKSKKEIDNEEHTD